MVNFRNIQKDAYVDTQATASNVTAQSSASVEVKKQPIQLVKDNEELNNQLLSYLESTKDVNVETLKTAFPALSDAQLNEIIVAYNQAKQVETENSPVEDNQETIAARADANAKAVEETAKTKEQSAEIYKQYDQTETADKATEQASEQTIIPKTAQKESLISLDRYLSSDFTSKTKEKQFDEYFEAYLTKMEPSYASKSESDKKKYFKNQKNAFLEKMSSQKARNFTDEAFVTYAIENVNSLYNAGITISKLKEMSQDDIKNNIFNNKDITAERINQLYDGFVSILGDDDIKSCKDENGTLNNEKLLNKVIEKFAEKSNIKDTDNIEKALVTKYAATLGVDTTKIQIDKVKQELVKALDTCSKKGISIGEYISNPSKYLSESVGTAYKNVTNGYNEYCKNKNNPKKTEEEYYSQYVISKEEVTNLENQQKSIYNEIASKITDSKERAEFLKMISDPDTVDEANKVIDKYAPDFHEKLDSINTKLNYHTAAKTRLAELRMSKLKQQELKYTTKGTYEENIDKIPACNRKVYIERQIAPDLVKIRNAKTEEERNELIKNLVKKIGSTDSYEIAKKYISNLATYMDPKQLTNLQLNAYANANANMTDFICKENNETGDAILTALQVDNPHDTNLHSQIEVNLINDNNWRRLGVSIKASSQVMTNEELGVISHNVDDSNIISDSDKSKYGKVFPESLSAQQQQYLTTHLNGYSSSFVEGASAAKVDDSIKEQYQSNIRNYVQNSSDYTAEEKTRINTALETGKISKETLSKTEVYSESKSETKPENKQVSEQTKTAQNNSNNQVENKTTSNQQTVQTSVRYSNKTTSNDVSSQYQQVLATITNQTTLDEVIARLNKVSYSIEAANTTTVSSVKSEEVTDKDTDKESDKIQTVKVDKKTAQEVVETLVEKATITETDKTTNETKTRSIASIQKVYDFVLEKYGVDGIRILVEKCSSGSRSYMLKEIVGKLDDGILSTLFVSADSNFKTVLFRNFNNKIYDLVTSNKIKFSDLDKNDQRDFLKNNISSFSSAEAFIRYLKQMGDTANLSELIGIWNSINPGKKIKMGSNGPEIYQNYISNSIDYTQNIGNIGSTKVSSSTRLNKYSRNDFNRDVEAYIGYKNQFDLRA